MIWFWIVAGLLVAAALAALLRPLLRGERGGSDDDGAIVAIFRRQLADIDSEAAQGRLAPEEAAAARTGITRRMLAAAGEASRRSTLPAGSRAEFSWRTGAAIGIAGVLPAAAIAIYVAVGAPADIGRAGAAAGQANAHDEAEFAAAADQLAARLKRDPGNVDDWIMLGRTLASLGRFPGAYKAYAHAIALAPDRPELHAELGEVLVLESQGTVTQAAEAEFAKSGSNPRARFYGAQAALQRGDTATAKSLLQALLADAPADAPWRKFVAQRLAEIAADAPPANPPSAGPSQKDIAAAQSMSPEERQTMIRGMVDRLAARLEQHPDDKAGWTRLAHAYDVLGETDKANAARARAGAVAGPSTATPPDGR